MISDSKLIAMSSLHPVAEMHVSNSQSKECNGNRNPHKIFHNDSPSTSHYVELELHEYGHGAPILSLAQIRLPRHPVLNHERTGVTWQPDLRKTEDRGTM